MPGDVKALERSFLFCVAWGLGGLLDKKDRSTLDAELRKLTDLMPPGVRSLLLSADSLIWRRCLLVWWQAGQEGPGHPGCRVAQADRPHASGVRSCTQYEQAMSAG